MKKYLGLIIAIIVVFAAFFGFIAYEKSQPDQLIAMTSREVVQQCTTDMATQFHIHSHLTIIADKKEVQVPAEIGIDPATNCMSPIHTHDATGLIHIESPVKKDFTLADFFFKWNKPFTNQQFLDYQIDSAHALKVYVNGQEVKDYQNLILQDKQTIVIDYYNLQDGPDAMPAPYQWPSEASEGPMA